MLRRIVVFLTIFFAPLMLLYLASPSFAHAIGFARSDSEAELLRVLSPCVYEFTPKSPQVIDYQSSGKKPSIITYSQKTEITSINNYRNRFKNLLLKKDSPILTVKQDLAQAKDIVLYEESEPLSTQQGSCQISTTRKLE